MGAEGGSPECNKPKCLILFLRESALPFMCSFFAQSLVYEAALYNKGTVKGAQV